MVGTITGSRRGSCRSAVRLPQSAPCKRWGGSSCAMRGGRADIASGCRGACCNRRGALGGQNAHLDRVGACDDRLRTKSNGRSTPFGGHVPEGRSRAPCRLCRRERSDCPCLCVPEAETPHPGASRLSTWPGV